MKVALLTREYPPGVYGGAGVHVVELCNELAGLVDLEVHCFGSERPEEPDRRVFAYRPSEDITGGERHFDALRTMSVDLAIAAGVGGAEIVHSHTWYTSFAGHLAKLLYGIPHVVTVHSLEPKRPWKAEQLGTGYALSCFCERTGIESADRVIAVSEAVHDDILECYPNVDEERVIVIPNAVDTKAWRRVADIDVLEHLGIDPHRPIVSFVGRITPQKGITHLLDAAHYLDPGIQLVLRAGSADTAEQEQQVAEEVAALSNLRDGVHWIRHPLEQSELNQLLSHATVSCCPSVYEPLGLVNLEAMACEAPVVASAVGGIPEVVDDGVTGYLVAFEALDADIPEPVDPDGFARDLAVAINRLVAEPDRARTMGQAGRQRVIDHFGWATKARQIVELYRSLVEVS